MMPAPLPTGFSRPLRIFIVENHPDTMEYMRFYLEESGHTVLSCGTISEALVSVPGARCDVLISDIGLPDGTGWELLEQLRLPGPIYAIAMSGFGMNADRTRSEAAGFRHHLLKPFSMKELDMLLGKAAREVHAAS